MIRIDPTLRLRQLDLKFSFSSWVIGSPQLLGVSYAVHVYLGSSLLKDPSHLKAPTFLHLVKEFLKVIIIAGVAFDEAGSFSF